ncbi:MAG: nucleotidyltransferase domain-containing protein [Bacteroidales bacterium]|nr:nucleotidyltransferase domain-containing protein [Bacteroidales bacterium]
MNENKKYGLSGSDINNIISVLKNNRKINEIILFGSRAKGNFSGGSDIDIALKGDNLKLNDVIDASIEIDNLFLPYKFDLIIFNRIKEPALIDHINRVGKVIYERKEP